jgi:hypothetical protein
VAHTTLVSETNLTPAKCEKKTHRLVPLVAETTKDKSTHGNEKKGKYVWEHSLCLDSTAGEN